MIKPKYFILDVDGVMTTGQFFYSKDGKIYKVFGPHDSDGLKMLKKFLKIIFITADKKGFGISQKRIQKDLGYDLKLISEEKRCDYLYKNFDLKKVIYMGDGYYDSAIVKKCVYGIVPKNGRKEALKNADYITPSKSGEGAVMDACLKIIKKFFRN